MNTHPDVEEKVEEFEKQFVVNTDPEEHGKVTLYSDESGFEYWADYKLKDWLRQALTEMKEAGAREEYSKNIITIGWHKGEMDFGVNCSIDQLTREEMRDLREMVCVAIGQAESMWRNSLDKKHPSAQTLNPTNS